MYLKPTILKYFLQNIIYFRLSFSLVISIKTCYELYKVYFGYKGSSRKACLLITIFANSLFPLLPSYFKREEKRGKE